MYICIYWIYPSIFVCVLRLRAKTSTLQNGSSLSPTRFLTLCLSVYAGDNVERNNTAMRKGRGNNAYIVKSAHVICNDDTNCTHT